MLDIFAPPPLHLKFTLVSSYCPLSPILSLFYSNKLFFWYLIFTSLSCFIFLFAAQWHGMAQWAAAVFEMISPSALRSGL